MEAKEKKGFYPGQKYPKALVDKGDEVLLGAYKRGFEVGANYARNEAGLKGYLGGMKYSEEWKDAFMLGAKKGMKWAKK